MPISYDIQGCCPSYYYLTNHPQSSLGKNHCIMGQQSDTHNMSRPHLERLKGRGGLQGARIIWKPFSHMAGS